MVASAHTIGNRKKQKQKSDKQEQTKYAKQNDSDYL